MFEHQKIKELNDFFTNLSSRTEKGVYFYRINAYTDEIGKFIKKYYEAARTRGVIIEGKIPNPDEKNLSYYSEIMGMDFRMHPGFIELSLKKWLPRMNDYQRRNVTLSVYDSLDEMRRSGKNENMLRNAYIKFMCWLYYKFERIMNLLGEEQIPKILYEGDISKYELMLISILCKAGCDVVLLQYRGDGEYRKLDPESALSSELSLPGMQVFSPEYSLRRVREEMQRDANNARLYGKRPELLNCTNAWMEGKYKVLDELKNSTAARGKEQKLFYNCFCRINGVEDRLTYLNELYLMHQELKNCKRRTVIVDGTIPQPSNEEISMIKRGNYNNQNNMLFDLTGNIQYPNSMELQRLMIKAFLDVLLEEAEKPENNLNRLTNKAVYLLCWLKRYRQQLFEGWKHPEISCFLFMGACRSENEALFLKMLARLPVDVVLLNPNRNEKCCLTDRLLYEENYTDSLSVTEFPREGAELRMGTAAYQAERELDTLLYRDSGIYRNMQYQKANTVNLQTMYEEIRIIWNEELKYRPNFSAVDESVNMPVIFSKITGVKDRDISRYWQSVKELINEDTILIKRAPYIESTEPNPMKSCAVEFFKNGRLQKNRIKEHPRYQYGFLREDMQNYILDKLQLLLNERLIKGTFENGMEYTVIAVVLNLQKNILRLLQKFDFTKKNPKVIYINTGEEAISQEDSILTAFLNLVGFDVVFFVPTGYQCVEKYFNKKLMEEHPIGEFMYDMAIPDFDALPSPARFKWRDKIFKRGT